MTVGERKPRGYQAGLVVCVVIIVVLGLWGYYYVANHHHTDEDWGAEHWWHITLDAELGKYKSWLNGNITSYKRQIIDLKKLINAMDSQIHNQQAKIDELNKIVGLQKSQVVVSEKTVTQGAGEETLVIKYSPYYAGYFNISMTSTTSNAYIKVSYWYGQYFNFETTLGTSGRVIVPILPTDGWGEVYVYVGNTNDEWGASHTISIIYQY